MKSHTIVILHGWGLSERKFQPLKKSLEKLGYRVLVPDFPGFGSSRMPDRPFSLVDYVDFLKDYLKNHKIESPIFIGHSFGGRVALKFQHLHPGFVQALILTGTPGFTPIAKRKLLFFIIVAKVGKLIFFIPPFSWFGDYIRKWYYYVVGARDFYRAEGVMRETFKRIVQEELVSSMKSVQVPCFLIWGSGDSITPLRIAYQMEREIKNAKLTIVPDTDHGLPYKHPDEFANLVDLRIRNL